MRDSLIRGLAIGILAVVLPACGSSSNSGTSSSSDSSTAVTYSDPDIQTFPDEGHTHVPVGTVITYQTDPPTSGDHYPYPASGGFYDVEIAAGFLVHAMEHGGVIIYYSPAVTDSQKAALQALAAAHPGIYGQIICVPRNDPTYAIILTAWTHWLKLTTDDESRINVFLAYFLGKGPESAPDSPWGDPFTSNTTTLSFFDPNAELKVSDVARPGSMLADTGMSHSAQPVTISVNLQVSAASSLADTESVQIQDAATSAVVAKAVYNAQGGTITFSIGGTTYPSKAALPGAVHTISFSVDSGHKASWTSDGSVVGSSSGFGTASVTVAFVVTYAGGAGTAPDFQFGNPVITNP